jgi:hypothetical protein
MISLTIPPELTTTAIELNRNFGSSYAWRFLAQRGISNENIYLFLKSALGSEQASMNMTAELFSMIARAN